MGAFSWKIVNKIAMIDFDQPSSKVNVLTTETMTEFSGIIGEIAKICSAGGEDAVEALIIRSKKDGIFIAGADIKEIENITSVEEARKKAESGKKILRDMQKLGLVTVSAINGACLGGGFELALACDYRVAAFGKKVKIGLPEVKLGVIPGFGGTIRLPRLVGLQRALTLILAGKVISGRDALKYGVVDRLFPEARFEEETVAFVKGLLDGSEKRTGRKKKKLLQVFLEQTPAGRAVLFSQAKKNILKQTKGFYPAPLAALEVIKRARGRRGERSFALESDEFSKLAVTDVSKNLIKVFYLIEEFKKYPWIDKAVKPRKVEKCGILGAGIMGGGIAQLVSYRGIPARIKDVSHDALRKALETAYGLFAYAVKKRKLKKNEAEYKFGLISPTMAYRGFENVDIVIEAVVEDLKVKQNVFAEADAIAPKDAVIVSNTSSLRIAKIAETAKSPQRTAGLHFFNPVHRMPLVEVIRSDKTSDEALATVIAFARKLGKTVIAVRDVPGFLINRILLSYLNEAGFLIGEGVRIERLDRIARNFGMPMGPAELIDEVGIDVGYKVVKILEEAYGPRMKVCPVLEKIKRQGLSGKKSKKGFYIHRGKKKTPNFDIYKIVSPPASPAVSDDQALRRMLYVMINEAARCLEEKVAHSPGVVDIGMIMGTGFPPFRGGLLRYADFVGINSIVKYLKSFEKDLSSARFKPCDYIIEKAEKKENFYPVRDTG